MKLFPNRRKEPRQPQKHRGAVVHTEQSEGYDDRITQGLIEKNILDEARASVALDKGDDQTAQKDQPILGIGDWPASGEHRSAKRVHKVS